MKQTDQEEQNMMRGTTRFGTKKQVQMSKTTFWFLVIFANIGTGAVGYWIGRLLVHI